MVGSLRLRLYNKRIKYDITVKRKISILRGDSGTGKSTLANGISKAITDTSFKIDCGVKVSVVPLMDEQDTLAFIKNRHEELIVIDENNMWLNTFNMAKVINESDCYFILITRDKLSAIPYSVDSVYEIYTQNNINTFRQIYTKSKAVAKPNYIVCEDSKSGFILYKFIDTCDNRVISAGNKDKVLDKAISLYKNGKHNILIIADGAAFGQYIEKLVESQDKYSISAYLPESFEFVLLHSIIFENQDDVQNIIKNPLDHIESHYKSSEEYFENVLREVMNKVGLGYHKNGISRCFIDQCCSNGLNCKYIVRNRGRSKLESLIELMPIDFSNIFISMQRNPKVVTHGSIYTYDK